MSRHVVELPLGASASAIGEAIEAVQRRSKVGLLDALPAATRVRRMLDRGELAAQALGHRLAELDPRLVVWDASKTFGGDQTVVVVSHGSITLRRGPVQTYLGHPWFLQLTIPWGGS